MESSLSFHISLLDGNVAVFFAGFSTGFDFNSRASPQSPSDIKRESLSFNTSLSSPRLIGRYLDPRNHSYYQKSSQLYKTAYYKLGHEVCCFGIITIVVYCQKRMRSSFLTNIFIRTSSTTFLPISKKIPDPIIPFSNNSTFI